MASATTAAADRAPTAPDYAAPRGVRTDVDREAGMSEGTKALLPVDVVLFGFDSAALDDADSEQIRAAALWQRAHLDHEIILEAHADKSGPKEYNLDLSTRRALAVFEELVAAGADPTRISMDARGESSPRSTDPRVNREVLLYANKLR
jgi:outer membrane protein OmpA-like peptidoglycan-associated protein